MWYKPITHNLKPQTVPVNNIEHLTTMQCSAVITWPGIHVDATWQTPTQTLSWNKDTWSPAGQWALPPQKLFRNECDRAQDVILVFPAEQCIVTLLIHFTRQWVQCCGWLTYPSLNWIPSISSETYDTTGDRPCEKRNKRPIWLWTASIWHHGNPIWKYSYAIKQGVPSARHKANSYNQCKHGPSYWIELLKQ